MKAIYFLISILFIGSTLFSQNSVKFQVNNEISKIVWVGKKVTVSHTGTIDVKSGSVQLENKKISSGELVINMTTIVITDIEDQQSNKKFKGHLTSSDFFGVKEYPTAKLVIKSVNYLTENKVELICDLKIKEATNKIKVIAKVLLEDNKLVAIGEVEIDRTKYDIKYGSGSFFDNIGDKAINNDFTIKFKVAAAKL